MKNKLNVLIFCDNQLNFENLKSIINSLFPNQLNVFFAQDILIAMETLKDNFFDIVFADIDLYARNGFDLISALKTFHGEIIFQSTSTDFAISAYDLCAADYILKPFSNERLKQAFERTFQNLKTKKTKTSHLKSKNSKKIKKLNSIIVKDNDSSVVIKTTDIIYFYSVRGLIYVKTAHKTYHQQNTLSNLEKLLDSTCFLRTSRSYICNLNHIKSIVTLKHNKYAIVLDEHDSELHLPIKRGIKLKIIERIKKSQTYVQPTV